MHRVPRRRLLAALLASLSLIAVIIPGTALAATIAPATNDATGATALPLANFTTVYGTDFVHAGFGGMRNDGTGTLTVSGVSGTVTEAYLYWQGPTNSTSPTANAAVTFAGNAVTGTNIGFSSDNCWGFANSQAYRADVTEFVTEDGSFALEGFVKDDGDINVNVNGASLIVFYDDGNAANNRDVVLFDGNDSNVVNTYDADGWNVSLPEINYVSGTANITMHVSDGQTFADAALVLNESTLAPAGNIFQGDSVPFGTFDSNGHLWDIKTFDVTSFLSPGPNTLTLTTGLNVDCLSLVVAAIDLPSPAHLTLAKFVENADVGTASTADWTLSATGPTTISGHTDEPAITDALVSAGTYTLAESGPRGYTPGAWSCDGGTITGSSLVLAPGETASCSITNTFFILPEGQPIADCPPDGTCVQAASGSGTAATLSAETGTFFDVYFAPLSGAGCGDGGPKDSNGVLNFDYTGTSQKTIVFAMSSSFVNPSGTGSVKICWISDIAFTPLGGGPKVTTGYLPNCNKKNPAAPCVLYRTLNRKEQWFRIAVLAPFGDPKTYPK